MLRVVTDEPTREDTVPSVLDELVREGARRMLAAALEAEVDAYIEAHSDERDERGRRLVVRNGRAEPRSITTGAGPNQIQAPRVNDRRVDDNTGERCRFRSSIIPPWCRKSPKVAEVLPLMYLHGMSTGDFVPALEKFFGSSAGLSSSVITRLTKQWQAERDAFMCRDLSKVDYVYVWVDGIHFNIRLEEERLCTLVVVGVRADGTKELVALGDGYRESTDSWADLLRDLRSRGMRAPVLAVGDGALGFWAALRDVWPETRVQRCWVHKVAENVADHLPEAERLWVLRKMRQAWRNPDAAEAERALRELARRLERINPDAAGSLREGLSEMFTVTRLGVRGTLLATVMSTNPVESMIEIVRNHARNVKRRRPGDMRLRWAAAGMEEAAGQFRRVKGYRQLPQLAAAVKQATSAVDGSTVSVTPAA
jgi:putative transposase